MRSLTAGLIALCVAASSIPAAAAPTAASRLSPAAHAQTRAGAELGEKQDMGASFMLTVLGVLGLILLVAIVATPNDDDESPVSP